MGWSKYFIHVPYSPVSIQALLCFLFNIHTPMITSERNLKFSMLPKDTFVCSLEQLGIDHQPLNWYITCSASWTTATPTKSQTTQPLCMFSPFNGRF